MIYALLRSAAGVALRWYYADVTIVGADRIPKAGPILVAVNHPNALVDVLVAARAVPRRLHFTAKATLFSNPLASLLLGGIGVLPLRRASDEGSVQGTPDPKRNAQSFDAVADALEHSSAILIFPEGKSHDEPTMAPSRTGAARMIIHARETRSVAGTRVVPIGLIFERKERPRSRIVAIVGDPIDADALITGNPGAVADLTAAIDTSLRGLTLNYASEAEATRDARIARALDAVLRSEAPPVDDQSAFQARAQISRVLPSLRAALHGNDARTSDRAASLEHDLLEFDDLLRSHGISLEDFDIDRGLDRGAVFTFRETAVFALAAPVAVWGWLNHLLPFSAALYSGRRVRGSQADPAMYTIVAGAAFVLAMYMVQGAAVALVAGGWWGLAYIVSLPIAAEINLRLRDRLRRAVRRARTYLRYRADPRLHETLVARARSLRDEAVSLARVTGIVDLP